MKAAPEHFLHGSRGDRVVILPQAFIDWLYTAARLRDLHAHFKGQDPLIDAVLVALSLAALERRGSGGGTVAAPRSEPAPRSPQSVTTKAIADRLRVTTRAVTQAINDERLAGVKDDNGRWWIDPDEAQRFCATS